MHLFPDVRHHLPERSPSPRSAEERVGERSPPAREDRRLLSLTLPPPRRGARATVRLVTTSGRGLSPEGAAYRHVSIKPKLSSKEPVLSHRRRLPLAVALTSPLWLALGVARAQPADQPPVPPASESAPAAPPAGEPTPAPAAGGPTPAPPPPPPPAPRNRQIHQPSRGPRRGAGRP